MISASHLRKIDNNRNHEVVTRNERYPCTRSETNPLVLAWGRKATLRDEENKKREYEEGSDRRQRMEQEEGKGGEEIPFAACIETTSLWE